MHILENRTVTIATIIVLFQSFVLVNPVCYLQAQSIETLSPRLSMGIESVKQVYPANKNKMPELTSEMIAGWAKHFNPKFKYDGRIDYSNIAITTDGTSIITLIYFKYTKEWHISFNNDSLFIVTGDNQIINNSFDGRKPLYEPLYVTRFIEGIKTAINNPRKTRKEIAQHFIAKRKRSNKKEAIRKERIKKLMQNHGYVNRLPLLLYKKEAPPIDMQADNRLSHLLFDGLYRVTEVDYINLVCEPVVLEILEREKYLTILNDGLYYLDQQALNISDREITIITLNLLDGAIKRAKDGTQRRAIEKLREYFLAKKLTWQRKLTEPWENILISFDLFKSDPAAQEIASISFIEHAI